MPACMSVLSSCIPFLLLFALPCLPVLSVCLLHSTCPILSCHIPHVLAFVYHVLFILSVHSALLCFYYHACAIWLHCLDALSLLCVLSCLYIQFMSCMCCMFYHSSLSCPVLSCYVMLCYVMPVCLSASLPACHLFCPVMCMSCMFLLSYFQSVCSFFSDLIRLSCLLPVISFHPVLSCPLCLYQSFQSCTVIPSS